MLFWRYVIAILALAAAATLAGLKLSQAWRDGAWRIVLLGATLGAGQTLCFWESIKTLETGIAVLLFYTYPAVTLALDRLVFKQRVRPLALLCIGCDPVGAGADHRAGAAQRRARSARSRLGHAGAAASMRLYLAINTRLLRRHPPLIGAAGLYLGMAVTFGADGGLARSRCRRPAPPVGRAAVHRARPRRGDDDLFTYSVPRLGASSFAILANTELVVVVSIGVLVLGEAMTPWRAIGGALIVGGIVAHALARRPASAAGATDGRASATAARRTGCHAKRLKSSLIRS